MYTVCFERSWEGNLARCGEGKWQGLYLKSYKIFTCYYKKWKKSELF